MTTTPAKVDNKLHPRLSLNHPSTNELIHTSFNTRNEKCAKINASTAYRLIATKAKPGMGFRIDFSNVKHEVASLDGIVDRKVQTVLKSVIESCSRELQRRAKSPRRRTVGFLGDNSPVSDD